MRILCVSIILASFIVFPGYCQVVDLTFKQLKLELKSEGVSAEFIKITEKSVKRMISVETKISDLKIILLDLWNQGIKARALKNAVAAVAELVESGDNAIDAATIASGAADKAEAEGLSGFGVGMRVKKAVRKRKAYLKNLETSIN